MTTTTTPRKTRSAPRKTPSALADGMWILVLHGVALVLVCGFLIYSSIAGHMEERRAFVALAAPIEKALNDQYVEDITYTRAYGPEHPSSRFYTFTDTLVVDGIERTDCNLSYLDTPEGEVQNVMLTCAIKPVHDEH